ncbi:MAG TPA: hypothetical protein VGI80_05625 [Pyrinomonadaceae bacterium]|jgi:hypothetical protein
MTPAIDFDLETEVRGEHIAARVRALEIGPELTRRFLREIRREIAGERFAHLLLEFEMAHAMSEDDIYQIMGTFAEMMPGLKIAVVNRDPRHHPSFAFGVRISQEFGEDYRYFTDVDQATRWLTGN